MLLRGMPLAPARRPKVIISIMARALLVAMALLALVARPAYASTAGE